jgi:hypothetical protein
MRSWAEVWRLRGLVSPVVYDVCMLSYDTSTRIIVRVDQQLFESGWSILTTYIVFDV